MADGGFTYCVSDIHNDYDSFVRLLRKIHFSSRDKLYILGDIFDRCDENPKPVQLYRHISETPNMVPLLGNHDRWLVDDLKRCLWGNGKRMYNYNTVDILMREMSKVQLKDLISWIESFPTYIVTECGGRSFMLAHAKTFEDPQAHTEEELIMSELDFFYLKEGLAEKITVIGHTTTDYIRFFMGHEREKKNTIWVNRDRTVFCIDCACGFGEPASRLAGLRLDDLKVFYVS